MQVTSRTTASGAETEALGAELAASLEAGDIVLVSGELGAGKTTLVRGAARALGVRGQLRSPTFTIGQRYPISTARAPHAAGTAGSHGLLAFVAHLDLYRLASLADEDPDLIADYVGPDTITFVEWPAVGERELGALGHLAQRVQLTHQGGDRRMIEIS